MALRILACSSNSPLAFSKNGYVEISNKATLVRSAFCKAGRIRSQISPRHRHSKYGGKPSVAADNTLNRQVDADAPNQFLVADIIYIKTPPR